MMNQVFILLLVFCSASLAAEPPTSYETPLRSCFDCVSKRLCPTLAKKDVMLKLVYAELAKQSIITSEEANQVSPSDVPSESKGACTMNNVAYFTALWFGYDAPVQPTDCQVTSVCAQCSSTKYMEWKLFEPTDGLTPPFDARKKVFDNAVKVLRQHLVEMFKAQGWIFDSNFQTFADIARIVRGDPCPYQKAFSKKDLIGILIEISNEMLCPQHRLNDEHKTTECAISKSYSENSENGDPNKDDPNKDDPKIEDETMTPHNGTLPPQNGTLLPQNGTMTPHNGTLPPQNGTMTPHNGTLPPHNGTLPPHNGTLPPQNGTLPPQNGTMTPHNGTLPPHNGTLPPHNGTLPPQNGTQSPANGTNNTLPQANRKRRSVLMQQFKAMKIPVVSEIAIGKVTMLIRVATGLFDYHVNKSVCEGYDYEKEEKERKCGDDFKDAFYLSKVLLFNKFHKAVMGCTQCPEERGLLSQLDNECPKESMERYRANMQNKGNTVYSVYKSFIFCSPYDDNCLDREKYYKPPEQLQAMLAIIRNVLGCGACVSVDEKCADGVTGNCLPPFKISSMGKYMTMEKLMATFQTGCMEEKGNSDSPLSSAGLIVEGIDYFYNLLTFLIKSEEIDDFNSDRRLYGLIQKEEDCTTIEELQHPQCKQYRSKFRVKTFLRLLSSSMQCDKSGMDEKYGYCKPPSVKDFGVCVLNKTSGEPLDARMYKSGYPFMLNGYFMGGCLSWHYNPIEKAMIQCAVFGSTFGYMGKIFGSADIAGEAIERLGRYILTKNDAYVLMAKRLFQIYKCDRICPLGYKYCYEMRACRPDWIACENENIDLASYKMLPHMYSTNKTSEPVNVSSIMSLTSSYGISIINRFTEDDLKHGIWEYNFDGHWHDVSNLPLGMAVKLSPTSQLRYSQHAKRNYGFRMFYYIEDKENFEIGKLIQPIDTKNTKMSYLFVYPVVTSTTDFIVDKTSLRIELIEDQPSVGIPVRDFFRSNTTLDFVDQPIPKEFVNQIPKDEIVRFTQMIQEFKNARPSAEIQTNIQSAGRFELVMRTEKETKVIPMASHQIALEYPNSYLVFRPHQNYNGNLTVYVTICNCHANVEEKKNVHMTFTVVVFPVNDPPTITSRLILFPPIPFLLANESSHKGFTIQEFLSESGTKDPEQGTDIGIAVYKLPIRSNIGKWQFHNGSKHWEDIIVQNTVDPLKIDVEKLDGSTEVRARYLVKEDSIRFLPNAIDTLWKVSAGRMEAFLGFSFWDKSDGITSGLHTRRLDDFIKSRSFSVPIMGVQLRLGCDGKQGSTARVDQCGICGGDGKKCIGCDGVKDSGALIDDCGVCTGGNTNLTYNYLRKDDCANSCGKFELDGCGVCQMKKMKKNFKDCQNVCFGNARTNECGRCTGGELSLDESDGKDLCGVCDGNGLSCRGCDDVPFSGKVKDSCGKCLLKSDKDFGVSCFALTSFHPTSAPASGGEEIIVVGAGFKESETTCYFEGSGYRYELKNMRKKDNTRFVFVTPKMNSGQYKLVCIEVSKFELKGFNVYESAITSVSPERIPINKSQRITISGQKFLDTGETYCVAIVEKKIYSAPGTFVDSSSVTCDLPPIERSMKLTLYLSFSRREEWTISKLRSSPSFGVVIHALAPVAMGAKMSDNYRQIFVTFSRNARLNRGKTCNDIFSQSTIAMLGKRFRCGFKDGKTLIVRLGSRNTITPLQDEISILKDSFVARNQLISDLSPATNLVLHKPENTIEPVAVISGNPRFGFCNRIKISGRKSSGAGGRSLEYLWDVTLLLTNISSLQALNIADLRAKLHSLPVRTNTLRLLPIELIPELTYNFTLQVKNFQDKFSNVESLVVLRTDQILPTVVIRGGIKQKIKASRLTKIQARVKIPKCAGGMKGLTFTWEIEETDVGLDLTSTNRATLYIYPGSLQGGRTYKVTLTVAMLLDPTISVSTTVELTVVGSPLIARIRGGKRRVVSSLEDFALDASLSRDPDRENSVPRYEWLCTDSQGSTCFVNDPSIRVPIPLQLPATSKVTISKGTLEANETYQFTLNYFKGSRNSSKTIDIVVIPKRPPMIRLFKGKKTTEIAEKRIKINGYVKSHLANVRIWLECMEVEGYAYVNLTESGVLLTPHEIYRKQPGLHPVGVVFSSNALDSGFRYNFRLYAENSDGIGYGDVIIETNAPPSVGVLESDQSEGIGLDTEFVLSAVEGWEDRDEDLPLSYIFGYISEDGTKHYLSTPSFESELTTMLPAGLKTSNHVLTVFVDVSDVHGSTSTSFTTVTVEPPTSISTEVISNLTNAIGEAAAVDDLSGVLSGVSSTLQTFSSDADVDTSNMTAVELEERINLDDTMLKFKENSTNSILPMMKEVKDAETQMITLQTVAESTKGGDKFDDQTKVTISDTVSDVVVNIIEGATQSVSRRRRRDTDNEETSEEKDGFSPEMVEMFLAPLGNMYEPNDYTNTSLYNKNSLTNIITTMQTNLCKYVAYGEDPIVAASSFAALTAFKQQFEVLAGNSVLLPCGVNCTRIPRVTLGTNLENMYKDYPCSSSNCTGACIAVTSYNDDIFAQDAFSSKQQAITPILEMKLFDSEEDGVIESGQLVDPVELILPVKGDGIAFSNLECHTWNSAQLIWTNTSCIVQDNAIKIDNLYYVKCSCSEVGIVAVTGIQTMSISDLPTTNDDGNSNNNNNTDDGDGNNDEKYAKPPSQVAHVSITINEDYDVLVAKYGKTSIEASIKTAAVLAMQIKAYRITAVTISPGSIVANLVVIPKDESIYSDAIATLRDDIKLLTDAISSDNLSITLNDGYVMKKENMSVGIKYENKEAESDAIKKDDSTNLLPVYITLGVLGALVICGGVAFFIYKNKFSNTPPNNVV